MSLSTRPSRPEGPLRPLERTTLAEIRRRPGITVEQLLRLEWCGMKPSVARKVCRYLVAQGLVTDDEGYLYAVRQA